MYIPEGLVCAFWVFFSFCFVLYCCCCFVMNSEIWRNVTMTFMSMVVTPLGFRYVTSFISEDCWPNSWRMTVQYTKITEQAEPGQRSSLQTAQLLLLPYTEHIVSIMPLRGDRYTDSEVQIILALIIERYTQYKQKFTSLSLWKKMCVFFMSCLSVEHF